MEEKNISNPLEWMSDPGKYFINSDSENSIARDSVDNELIEEISESYTGDILGYARALIKAIVIAKKKGILPEEIDKNIKNPEDLAQLATEGAVMADTLLKLAKGDIDTYEKLANRILDTIHVLALSTIEYAVQKGVPYVEDSLVVALEYFGQKMGYPGVGTLARQLLDSFAPILRNRSRALLIAGCNKLNEYSNQAKDYIFAKIRKHRELKEAKREKGDKKNTHTQTETVTVTSLA